MIENREKTARLLKIGILGAVIILAGDLVIGWGVKDTLKTGIEAQISQYLTVSDFRMVLAAILGFTGVPLAVAGHYAIYRQLKEYSGKYAGMYGIGILGFLAFGGAGVHVSCVEAAYFYKSITATGSSEALALTMKFVLYFLVPLYFILIVGWLIMVAGHLRAVMTGLSPYPKWGWIFSMLPGTLLFSLVVLFGNHAIANALAVGAFSLGNIWSLTGHLWMLKNN